MKPVLWLAASSAVIGLAAGAATGALVEILAGMLGPLAAVAGSWLWIQRTYDRAPAQVTQAMIAAFGAKLVFFGVYVAVALRVMALRPVPFVASFTVYFIGLYLAEAVLLRRLFAR